MIPHRMLQVPVTHPLRARDPAAWQTRDLTGLCMQVIFCAWCILPPSAWFSSSNPLSFLAMSLWILLLTAAAASVHSSFWAWVMMGLGSSSQAHAVHAVAGIGEASPAALCSPAKEHQKATNMPDLPT